jgi:hypothetical protein
MLKIELVPDGQTTIVLLTGRMQSGCIGELRRHIDDANRRAVLDLADVTLVDLDVVKFLRACEEEGMELRHCSPYIQEWILRERAEWEHR